jgi:outer membrane receptor protein involved in Fe transport
MSRVTVGNLDLKPEKADTTIVGVVFSPTFLRQFTASVDFYKINLNGAITTLGNQEIVDRCFRGETAICQYVIRNSANVITQLIAKPINVAVLKTKGFDIEGAFRQPLGDLFDGAAGTVTLRALASHIAKRTTISGGVSTEDAGNNAGATPKWRYLATLNYDDPANTFGVTVRGISAGVYDNLWVSGVDIDDNRIPGATYVDLSASHRFHFLGLKTFELFGKVENLLDKDPAVVASSGISGLQTNPTLYDVVGRSYRLGIRFAL